MKGVDIMLTFIIVYLIIGLVLELIVNGKKTIKGIKNKRFNILTSILGTIFMSVISPFFYVYVFITSMTHDFKKIES